MTETPTPDRTDPGPPTLRDRVKHPPGVLPKNVQTWVILGVALLMIAILALETPRKRDTEAEGIEGRPAVVDPNERRIQEYRRRIEEHAQRLAAERARLEQAQLRSDPMPEPLPAPPESYGSPYFQQPPARPERNAMTAIERDKEERAYNAPFASNVALSYRQGQFRERTAPSVSAQNHLTQPSAPYPYAGPAHLDPSFPFYPFGAGPVPPAQQGLPTNLHVPTGAESPEATSSTPSTQSTSSTVAEPANPRASPEKHYRLFEGTILEAVLTNRLTGSFAGPVNCMLTENVYSHDRQTLLIPKGSRILGEVRQVDHFGQERLAVVFHRLIMPNGYSLDLGQFQGLNQIGETGLKDQVNRHYLRVFGVSLAIGAIAGLAQAGTRYGDDYSAGDAYRQGVSRSVSASSTRILDRFLNVLPTFTIREGHRIKIHLAGDLLVPAYAGHERPPEL